ncbi:MAG: CPBP family intramembrane metalloprotease [Clostridia bacterium]|nr:CPBP family intramembrane metalloprotease [Clostridia bacterium]
MQKNDKVYAPVFVSVIMILLLISDNIIKTAVINGADYYLSYTVVQLIVYMLPLAFYCKVRNMMFFKALKFNLFSRRYLFLTLFLGSIFLVGILFFLFIDLYYFNGKLIANNVKTYNFAGEQSVYALLGFVIVPAIVKELLFRGVVLSEYRTYGAVCAILMSSFLFSFSSMNFSSVVILLYTGVFFGTIAVVTDSVIPSVILHIMYNAFEIYAMDTVTVYMRKISDSAMPLFVLGLIIIILLFFTFSTLEGMYRAKAEECDMQNEIIKKLNALERKNNKSVSDEPKKSFVSSFSAVVISPFLWFCIAVFLIAAVINL